MGLSVKGRTYGELYIEQMYECSRSVILLD